jgi:diguanylate cyclase (GGDEF)-like protein
LANGPRWLTGARSTNRSSTHGSRIDMSFRTRLTSFFVLIVVVPMVAIGVLGFRLISDSEQGKANARVNGLASVAASVYQSEVAAARADARAIARDRAVLSPATRRTRLSTLVARSGLARVTVTGGATPVDVGDKSAIAPGSAVVTGAGAGAGASRLTVTASELTAAGYVRELVSPGVEVAVQQGGHTLATSLAAARGRALPDQGTVKVAGVRYRVVTLSLPGFGTDVNVSVLSDLSATSVSVGSSQLVALAFIAGFLFLAFSFSVLASKALQGQLGRFLGAARRLAGGDFSSPIQTRGHDEFAALGEEFNNMSTQLANRLDDLTAERARLRESIRRIGQTFAANLDRGALLELALKTAVDAVEGSCGRISLRPGPAQPLAEAVREGSLEGFDEVIYEAEREALRGGDLGECTTDELTALAVGLGPVQAGGRAHGVVTVARRGREFGDDDRELLRSLAAQATLALENVDLHHQVQRQAVTDELTGLANHGRFQEVLGSEMEQVRRYQHPVGLIMLDIDDFKAINDTYGHQQGDVVLRHVARVLQDNSRDADSPARYGGEEMALILPHTDLEGSHAIAERVREAIEGLRISRLDGEGTLRVTASVGVAASSEGSKDALISDADGALYDAKRQGKNRTISAPARTANVTGAE